MNEKLIKSNEPSMSGNDVLEIVNLLNKANVDVWLDGGWAVDAIIKEQTRQHSDLDVVVEFDKVEKIKNALHPLGFEINEDEFPTRFVLADAKGRHIDFHIVTFNAEGGGVQQLQDGRSYVYSTEGFQGIGEINRQQIKCLTADVQAECHYGYEPDDNDRHDMKQLAQSCGVVLKKPYID